MEKSRAPANALCFHCDRLLSVSRLCQLGLCHQKVTAQEIEEALRDPEFEPAIVFDTAEN